MDHKNQINKILDKPIPILSHYRHAHTNAQLKDLAINKKKP